MTSIKSILAAVDFSEDSRQAASRATMLASEHGARLELLHVINDVSLRAFGEIFHPADGHAVTIVERAERMLDELAPEATAGKRTALKVKCGQVLEEILSAADLSDMLVIGARGWNPLRDLILGTTATRLLRKCKRPVMVVKRPPRGPYRRVVVPVDFSPHSSASLRMAVLIAPRADIDVVNALDFPFEGNLWLADVGEKEIEDYREQVRRDALARMESLLKEVDGNRRNISSFVERGDAARTVLSREEELGADLIVMGKHARSYAGEMLLGSVTRHVLSGSKSDVLVVHE